MARKIYLSFVFLNERCDVIIDGNEIDTEQYENIWATWTTFKRRIDTGYGFALNVWFDLELTAQKDLSQEDKLGTEGAYINVYSIGTDELLRCIEPISITIE